jgi:hypothetical protein
VFSKKFFMGALPPGSPGEREGRGGEINIPTLKVLVPSLAGVLRFIYLLKSIIIFLDFG